MGHPIKPTYGSCFSGIDGLGLGLEWAGWEPRWQIEKDSFCIDRLEEHWPDVHRETDIVTVDSSNLKRVDLIVGGFPCQPFSHAGRRSGTEDDRYLWPAMLAVIRDLRPTFVLAENVYGLVTQQSGLALETVYLDLEAAGYEVAPPIVFPAAAVGAPHRRDRVWICAHARHDGQGAEHRQQQEEWPEELDGIRKITANSECSRLERPTWPGVPSEGRSCVVTPADGALRASREWWSSEPSVGRVVNGFPAKLDKDRAVAALKSLGNAVVPQAAYRVGKALIESMAVL